MREFKKGYIYSCKGINYLILNKTKCFITYQEIFHLGRFNEKFHEPKRVKLTTLSDMETFYTGTIEVNSLIVNGQAVILERQVINMSTKKIFYKKDYNDIMLFYREEGQAVLSNNYKGCKIVLDGHFSTAPRILIYDSLGDEYEQFLCVKNALDNYETLSSCVLNSFSMFEAKYIQGEAKTLEEVMQERLEQKKAEEEAQEAKNSEALVNYINSGDENFYADCLVYYENKKNLSNSLNKLIHTEIENYSKSQLKIAIVLRTVYDKKLYEVQGYKNIYDYANDEFNIARGTVSNWLMIVNNFCILNEQTGFYNLDERLKDFSITQLVLLRQLTIEQIEELGITPDLSTRSLKALIKEKLNINAIATSVKPDTDTSALPDNPDDEEELYKEAEALDGSMNEPEESEGSEEEQPTEKVKLRLMFTGGSELSDTQIVFLNKFLTSQPKNKKLKLVFIEEN